MISHRDSAALFPEFPPKNVLSTSGKRGITWDVLVPRPLNFHVLGRNGAAILPHLIYKIGAFDGVIEAQVNKSHLGALGRNLGYAKGFLFSPLQKVSTDTDNDGECSCALKKSLYIAANQNEDFPGTPFILFAVAGCLCGGIGNVFLKRPRTYIAGIAIIFLGLILVIQAVLILHGELQ